METHGQLMRRAALLSLGVSLLLVAIKLATYLYTNSVAMLATFADSAMDLFTATINIVAIRSALQPADEEHRFGHGKAEPLAGMAQFAFIAGSAVFLVIQGVQRFFKPEPVDHPLAALVVMAISIVGAGIVIFYQRHVIAKTGSIAIRADAAQFVGDLASSIGVIVAIALLLAFGWTRADPLIALFVAAVLVWNGWGVFRQSYDQLMDRELPDEDRERIKAIVRGHKDVLSLHELRTRASGVNSFIQLHIELAPEMTLMRAHAISDEVEDEIRKAFPQAEVIIHQDPAGLETAPRE